MSQPAGRNRNIATETQSILDPAKMTLRQYAVACLELHVDDWETANGRVSRDSKKWKDAFWFFMRRMKSHPKLLNASPQDAATVFHKLFMNEPTIQNYCLSEDFGLDDVVTFVSARWDKVRMLADRSPLEAAIEAAKAEKTQFIALPCSLQAARSHVEAMRKSGAISSVKAAADYCKKHLHGEIIAAEFSASSLSSIPSYGLFLAALSRLHAMLARADQQHPVLARPALILGTDNLGTLLGVQGKTAWEYRQRLVHWGVLTKLPKQGMADRFALDYLLLGTLAVEQERTHGRRMTAYRDVDLD